MKISIGITVAVIVFSLSSFGQNYQSPFGDRSAKADSGCRNAIATVENLINDFEKVARDYKADADNDEVMRLMSVDEIKVRISNLDVLTVKLLNARNCMVRENQRDSMNNVIDDAGELRTYVSSRWSQAH